jgi:hypothetical protein
LNCAPLLSQLHGLLRKKGPLYGIGRMELVPVRSSEAIGFYLGGYLSKSKVHKPADAQRSRPVNYSQDCPRAMRGKFSWNEAGWLYRAKVRIWARGHGCTSLEAVAALFGPHWAYHHRQAIWAVQLENYPSEDMAASDGVMLVLPGTKMQDIFRRAEAYGPGFYKLLEVAAPCASSQAERGAVPPEAQELRGLAGGSPCSTDLSVSQVVAPEQSKRRYRMDDRQEMEPYYELDELQRIGVDERRELARTKRLR